MTPADVPVQNSAGETISAQEEEEPYVVKEDGFEADAALGLEKAGGIALGTPNADGGVAEIVAYDEENGKAYVVNGQESVLNIFDVRADGSFGGAEKRDVAALMAEADPAFTYGDMTSVAVSSKGAVAVALQDADYTAPAAAAAIPATVPSIMAG